jgi:HSP20 family protein
MDRIFDDSFREFKNTPEHSSFFDEPRFGSSLDVKDEGNNYVVRAYLPDRNTKDVDVTVEGRTLRIGAKVEETTNEKGKRAIITHKAQYSQILTLPGPVQADKMKVDKKEGMLIVTLPKAA